MTPKSTAVVNIICGWEQRKKDGSGVIKINGKLVTVRRAVWELCHGALPSTARVNGCPEESSCVRIEHLKIVLPEASEVTTSQFRGMRGAGSKRQIKPGMWQLTVPAGTYEDGGRRRSYKTVQANSVVEANIALQDFATEIRTTALAPSRSLRDLIVDEAIETFLIYLADDKGREVKTVKDYRNLHLLWFSPVIGAKKVKNVDEQMIDDIFGNMRRSGLSKSRMNQAKSLYGPFFRWAISRRIISRSPMAGFQLPTSKQVSKERLPPEVEELTLFLNAALNQVPDITVVLVLAAVSGMRRGELVGLRRSRIGWDEGRLTVDTAIGIQDSVKHTKTRVERSFYVDKETIEMLRRHCDEMDARSEFCGTTVAKDGYVFSLEPDCSKAMTPDYVTKRVAELKDYLGISVKRPDVAALEDKALELRRQAPVSREGRTGPAPTGGLSFADIGKQLGRSERWAALAVKSAERREEAQARGLNLDFDGSIIALRKFTSSELLDAGFNVSLVAQRQGHGPQVLIKHYSKGCKSADRKAAEHLGRVVHSSGNSA